MTMGRRLMVYAGSLLIAVVLLELLSLALFGRLTGQKFDYAILKHRREERIRAIEEKLKPSPDLKALYTFHPYVGYAGRIGAHPWGDSQPPFNNYGLLSIPGYPYPYKKHSGKLVIAVLGGSVAEIFANTGEEPLNRFLREADPRFDKRVVLIGLATGGYKEPQQLFNLEYALLSGFEFDAVLNLDGFNELALASENARQGINPIFPSGHHMGLMAKLTQTSLDFGTVDRLSQYYGQYKSELGLLRSLNRRPFRYSVFLNLVGERWTVRNQAKLKELEYQLSIESQQGIDPAFRGPALGGPQPVMEYEVVAKIWQQSSRMLHAVCERYKLPYIHVLQPNQYVEGSKPLTEREKSVAVNPQNVWGIHARKGYKYLVEQGSVLRKDGIAFYDFTMVFKDSSEDLYLDDCCHFGPKGVEIVAKQLVPVLRTHLEGFKVGRSGG